MPHRKRRHPAVPAAEPAAPEAAVVQRPDGYYWVPEGGLGEVGPFESYERARADRDAGEESPAGAEGLLQAEQDIGMNDWLDRETGDPAEGQSPPHLDED